MGRFTVFLALLVLAACGGSTPVDEYDGGGPPPGADEPQVVWSEDQDSIGFVAADSEAVYWSTGHGLKKLVHGATQPERLTGDVNVGFIALDDTNVYYAEHHSDAQGNANNSISVVSKSGAMATRLTDGWTYSLNGIAVDDTTVYFTTDYVGQIVAVPKLGGEIVVLADGQNDVWGITVDDTDVYWADDLGHTVSSVPKIGGPVTLIATEVRPSNVVRAGDYLYWNLRGDNPGEGLIRRVRLETVTNGQPPHKIPVGDPETIVIGRALPQALAVDDEYVYWLDYYDGRTARAPLAGGPVEELWKQEQGALSLCLTADKLYWTNSHANTLLALPK